jgi:Spy/CpxP family protein refolding chaperone
MITTRFTRGLALVLGSALLLAFSGQAGAQGRMERLREHRMERLTEHLSLTPDQVTAIREVFASDGPAQQQIFHSLRRAQGELRQLALNGADAAALEQKAAEVEGLVAQGLQRRVQRLQKIAAILTPEQRAKFAQLPQGHPHMMKGGPPPHS